MINRKTFIEFENSEFESMSYLTGILEDARTTTLQRVEGIKNEELHWQYAEGWNTIGALLQHIYSLENIFRIIYIEQRELSLNESIEFEHGRVMGKYIPQLITGESLDVYLNKLTQSRIKLFDKIKTLDKTEFYKKREGYNLQSGYNVAWVLYHLAEDEVHHRGQISILRKLYQLK